MPWPDVLNHRLCCNEDGVTEGDCIFLRQALVL
jgi:hypothetical protein